MTINGLDLFTGIGGITLALSEWVRPIAYVEIDRYAQAVLKSRMQENKLPKAPIWDDVRTLDGTQFRGLVDIIYGGFPCQDISLAGLRKGLEAERSGLFFEIMRLAKEIKPTFIFLENVPGIRSHLSTVAKEMAYVGYNCRWTIVTAFEVGAPHKRSRWFLLAHANGKRRRLQCFKKRREEKTNINDDGKKEPLADLSIKGLEISKEDKFCPNQISESTTCNISNFNIIGCKQKPNKKFDETGWWATEPNVVRVANGVPFRVDRIKCLGNAVVPLQAKEAFKILAGINK